MARYMSNKSNLAQLLASNEEQAALDAYARNRANSSAARLALVNAQQGMAGQLIGGELAGRREQAQQERGFGQQKELLGMQHQQGLESKRLELSMGPQEDLDLAQQVAMQGLSDPRMRDQSMAALMAIGKERASRRQSALGPPGGGAQPGQAQGQPAPSPFNIENVLKLPAQAEQASQQAAAGALPTSLGLGLQNAFEGGRGWFGTGLSSETITQDPQTQATISALTKSQPNEQLATQAIQDAVNQLDMGGLTTGIGIGGGGFRRALVKELVKQYRTGRVGQATAGYGPAALPPQP